MLFLSKLDQYRNVELNLMRPGKCALYFCNGDRTAKIGGQKWKICGNYFIINYQKNLEKSIFIYSTINWLTKFWNLIGSHLKIFTKMYMFLEDLDKNLNKVFYQCQRHSNLNFLCVFHCFNLSFFEKLNICNIKKSFKKNSNLDYFFDISK